MSNRRVRSPDAPKVTKQHGSAGPSTVPAAFAFMGVEPHAGWARRDLQNPCACSRLRSYSALDCRLQRGKSGIHIALEMGAQGAPPTLHKHIEVPTGLRR